MCVAFPAALQAAADLSKVVLTKQTFINGLATLGAKVCQICRTGCAAFLHSSAFKKALGDKPCASKLWLASSHTEEKEMAVEMQPGPTRTRCHCADDPVLCSAPPAAACCVQTECRVAAISNAEITGRGCVAKAVSYCCTPGAVPPPPQPVYPPAPYGGGYNYPNSNYNTPAAYNPYPNYPNTNYPGYQKSS